MQKRKDKLKKNIKNDSHLNENQEKEKRKRKITIFGCI